MSWTVYSKDGQTARCVLHKLEYSGTFMGDRTITASLSSENRIEFNVFDYIEYRGEKFEIELLPTVKKVSSHEYKYELRFVSLKYELERCMMRNIVPGDNGIVYPTPLTIEFTGTVKYLIERIQACLDAMYGSGTWSITIAEGTESEEKNISISSQNCWDALSLVNTEYKLNYFVRGRNITIGGTEPVVDNVFEYGKGKGLYEIERVSDTDTGVVTKLRAYGGTRNLDYSYPKRPEWKDSVLLANYALSPLRLMLPSFKTDGVTDYILASEEAIAKYGIREGVITYDDIYPSITGMTNSAGQAIDEIKSVSAITSDTQPTFTVELYDLGFDLNDSITTEEAQISMKSGALQGYAFTITNIVKAEDGSYTLTLGRNTLESSDTDNFTVPNKGWNMKAGDKFVLLNILMPQEYIRNAENRLLARAKEYLAKYSSTNYSYNVGVDEIFMARNVNFYNDIVEGKRLTVNDSEIGINNENIIIQSLTIKEGDKMIPTFEVTLNNEPSASTLDRIQGQISEVESSVNNSFSSQSELLKQYRKKLDKSIWDSAWEIREDESSNQKYIFGKLPVVTQYGITMYADGDELDLPSIYAGLPIDGTTIGWVDGRLSVIGGGTGGSTTLGGLTNVGSWADVAAPEDRVLFQARDSTQWSSKLLSELVGSSISGIKVNNETYAPGTDGYITIPDYPTSLDWDEIDNKPTWIGSTKPSYAFSEITGKPTTLAGYGITDAYSQTDADNRYVKKAGDTMTGSLKFTGGTDGRTVELSNSGSLILTGANAGWASGLYYKLYDGTTIGYAAAAYGTAAALSYYYYGGSYTSPAMTILPNGNVGIGTTSPTSKLHVASDMNLNGIPIKKHASGVLEIDGDLIVTGGITMYAQGNYTASTILDALPIDDTTLSKTGGKLSVIGGGGSGINGIYVGSTLYTPDADKYITLGDYYNAEMVRTANAVLAAPNGSNGSATFRKLVVADIPSLPYSKISDAPASLKNPYALTITLPDGSSTTSYDGSAAKSLTLTRLYKSAEVDSATTDSGTITPYAMNTWTKKQYVTALGTSGNYLTWTKNGATNNITVPYASVAGKFGTANVGSATNPIYLNAGTPTACSYTFGNASGNAALNNGTLNTNLNADMIDGVHFQNMLERSYSGTSRTNGATGWFRIGVTKLLDANSISFMLTISRGYSYSDNQAYTFSINIVYAGYCTVTQISGATNAIQLDKIRITGTNSGSYYVDVHINTTADNQYYWTSIGQFRSYTAWEANATALTNSKEFTVNEYNAPKFCSSRNDKAVLTHTEAPYLDAGYTVGYTMGVEVSDYNYAYIGFRYKGKGSAANIVGIGIGGIGYPFNILGNGNVGIGTESPTEKLTVIGNISSTYYLLNNSATNPYLRLTLNSVNWYAQAYQRDSVDYLYVGAGSANSLRIDTTGNVLTPGGVTMYSDIRKKDVLEDVMLPLEMIAEAPLFSYTYKGDKSRTLHIGTSAQYWQDVSGIVRTDGEDGYLTMDYNSLLSASVFSLAKYTMRHETEIERLKRENEEMRQRINELERRAA